MPVFITQGRFSQEALKGMLARPEDRTEAVSRLMATSGAKLLSYYMTMGEYDFLTVSEAPNLDSVFPSLIAGAASGGVSDLKTTLAITGSEMKEAFAKAASIAGSFKGPGMQR